MKAIPPAEPTAIVGEAASKRCWHPLFFCPDDFGKGKANVMSNEAPQQTPKQPVQPPMQIELQNVKKVYPVTGGEVVALDNISLKIRRGDIFGIIGLSGAGKSTLIRCINRLDTPTEGKILIDGQNVPDMNKQQLRQMRRKVSMIFQQFNLLMQQTVAKNIAYPMECIGVPRAKINARVKELLEVVGLESKAKAYPAQLSGGQRQRISLARAILKDAPIVVLDEATAYADPENEEKMEAAIAELVKGKTLVVIAHKLPAIMNADQICVMDHGKLVATGKHQELIQSCPEYQKLWKAAQDSAEWKVHTAKEGK